MILCHCDVDIDLKKFQLVFIVEPQLREEEVLQKIIDGNYWVDPDVYTNRVKELISKKVSKTPKERMWLLKEPGFDTIVTIMDRELY